MEVRGTEAENAQRHVRVTSFESPADRLVLAQAAREFCVALRTARG